MKMKYTLLFLKLPIILVGFHSYTGDALKCRTNDGLSDEELKKITRSCMKKVTGNASYNHNSHKYDQSSEYDEYSDDDSNYGSTMMKNNNDNDNESFRIRNRNYLQGRVGNDRQKRSSDRIQQQQQHQYENHNYYGSNTGGQHNSNNNNNRRTDSQNSNSRYGNNNNGYYDNKNYQNSYGSNNGCNGNSNNGYGNKNNSNNFNNRDKRQNQTSEDQQNCVVHCFFSELNTLNNNGFPDKHKVLRVLTKDIRDRELREFYSDSIKDCFRHLEQDYRKEKCKFSKELILCMAEYAKANCEDWYDHTMIFSN